MKVEYNDENKIYLSHKWYLLARYGTLFGCIGAIVCLIGYGVYNDSQKPIYEINHVFVNSDVESTIEIAKLIKISSNDNDSLKLTVKYYRDSFFDDGQYVFTSYNNELNDSLILGKDISIESINIFNNCKQIVTRPDGTQYDMVDQFKIHEPEHKEKNNRNNICGFSNHVLLNGYSLEKRESHSFSSVAENEK